MQVTLFRQSERLAYKKLALCCTVSLIGMAALWLRLHEITFGLPQRLHPDEWSQVEVAWNIARGDLNPHFYRYPTGFIYLLASVFWFVAAFRPSVTLAELYLVGRIISALFGTATVLLVILWGSRLWGYHVGLIAGALLAIAYTPIEQSHYAVVDGPMTFWITAGLFCLSLAVTPEVRRRTRLLWLATCFIGLAVATKYTALLLMAPLMIAVWLTASTSNPLPPRRLVLISLGAATAGFGALLLGLMLHTRREAILAWAATLTTDGELNREYLELYASAGLLLVIAGIALVLLALIIVLTRRYTLWSRVFHSNVFFLPAAVFLLFALLSPYHFIEWRLAARDFFYEHRHMRIGSAAHYAEGSPQYLAALDQSVARFPSAIPYYELMSRELSLAVLLLSSIGMAILGCRKPAQALVIGAFLLPYLFIICSWTNWGNRYALALYPSLVLLAAYSYSVGAHALTRQLGPRTAAISISGFVLLLLAPLLSYTSAANAVFALPDTRELAMSWAETHVPPRTTIAYDYNTPDFVMDQTSFRAEATRSAFFLEAFTPEQITGRGYEYIFTARNVKTLSDADPVLAARYERFLSDYQQTAVFQATVGQSRGETIYVYQRR